MVINPRMADLSYDPELEDLRSKYIKFKKLFEIYSPIAKDILRIYNGCEMCGKCCREERVLVGEKELPRLVKFSGDKFKDYIYKDFGKRAVYLKLPCPYLEENENGKCKCKCKINHLKPLVCTNYPFIFLYGYFISLSFCPYGNKIIKDIFEFNKENGIMVEEGISDNTTNEIVKDIDNFYDKIGMKNGEISSKILNMPFDNLVEFYKWIKKKKIKRRRK